jgi:ribosomal protein S12
MVTIATGQSRHHVVLRVVKVLKYGHGGVITPLENMAEIVVSGGRLKNFDCVRWNFVQVSTNK